MTKNFLPYAQQTIDENDIAAVTAVLRSDYLTTGPTVQAFENVLAEHVEAKFAVCVNSGTAALHLSLAGLHIQKGDYVIVPPITFLATANAVRLCGAEVLFADVDPESGLMRPEDLIATLEKNKNKKIKAVLPVHLAGQTENLISLRNIAIQENLYLIEDACHALGTQFCDEQSQYPIGSSQHSDATVFSFHPVKTIAMGEGGAITTQNRAMYNRMLQLRNHGMSRNRDNILHPGRAVSVNGLDNSWYYEMLDLGLNYRQSDIHCALGISQFKKLDQFIAKRRELVKYYDQLLKELYPVIRPIKRNKYSNPAWHLYSVLIEFETLGMERAYLMQALRQKKIGTQVHYIPVNEQPYYENRYGEQLLPGAQKYYKHTLSLPLFPAMEKADVEYVVQSLKRTIM